MRRLVVHHQKKRLVLRPLADEVDRELGDDVGRVASGVGLVSCCRVEHRIEIGALSRKDFPAIEALRIASEVPLADHAGVVAALLQQLRDRRTAAVEPVENGHAVDVRVLAGEDGGAARRADRVGGEDVFEERALFGNAIEVRRLVDARPIGADGVRRVIVRHDEDDVGPIGGDPGTAAKGKKDAGEKNPVHATGDCSGVSGRRRPSIARPCDAPTRPRRRWAARGTRAGPGRWNSRGRPFPGMAPGSIPAARSGLPRRPRSRHRR